MKKSLTLCMAALLVFGMFGCAADSTPEETTAATESTEAPTETTAAPETTEAAPPPAEESTVSAPEA